ncbi:hypothetical protein LOAG_15539 [Loa loa]|uniref:Uncharacterized protein n=1 Tax=Loa loa TaxID=7209 RepID=A0A1S0TFL5_LOALO|nr:hypothetical protein LOAG_15539 [Loa loa]EFO12990.1 hypothetical protein LOAG_15539 [Loa loa]
MEKIFLAFIDYANIFLQMIVMMIENIAIVGTFPDSWHISQIHSQILGIQTHSQILGIFLRYIPRFLAYFSDTFSDSWHISQIHSQILGIQTHSQILDIFLRYILRFLAYFSDTFSDS